MQNKKPIDDTARRVGKMLCDARRVLYMPHDEVARLLHIMPDELLAYERGVEKIPADVLLWIILLGYKLLRIRKMEHNYRNQRRIFYKLRKTITELE